MKRHFITFYRAKRLCNSTLTKGLLVCHSGRENKGKKTEKLLSMDEHIWLELNRNAAVLLLTQSSCPFPFFHRVKTMPLSCYLRSHLLHGNSPKVIKLKHVIGCAAAWCWRDIFSRKLILFNTRSSSGYINNFI